MKNVLFVLATFSFSILYASTELATRLNDYGIMADSDPVWDMMLRGTESLKNDIKFAMRQNDRVKFDSAIARAKKFREDHIYEIRNIKFIAGQYDDATSRQIVQTANEWDLALWYNNVRFEPPSTSRKEDVISVSRSESIVYCRVKTICDAAYNNVITIAEAKRKIKAYLDSQEGWGAKDFSETQTSEQTMYSLGVRNFDNMSLDDILKMVSK